MLNRHVVVVLGAFVLLDVVREAMQHSGIGVSKMALWMEIDQAQLERQLQGKEHLSLRRMHKCPLVFLQYFFFFGMVKVGLPKPIRRAALIQLALMAGRRQARMESPIGREEQVS
jgi:hypothetical protein